MRTIGTVVRGVRAPIIREGDNIAEVAAASVMEAWKEAGIEPRDRDVVAVTESVVARAQGNYATLDQIAKDVREKTGGGTVGVAFPIMSRNRFSLLLRGMAMGCKKIVLLLSYPSDEVGNGLVDWDKLDVNIFHIGYILLLPHLDEPDAEYGTKMARLLHRAQKAGMKTSIDVVSEAGERFARLVTPALKYTDYCIINELETQQTTGVLLRGEDGVLHVENMKAALQKLHELGVAKWAVIHCPEIGCGMDENGNYYEFESLKLPKGYIKGTVGAGDAFCAGVLYAAETDMPLPEALKLGACSAAASLSEVSASDGVKTKDEVLKLYELYGKK